MLSKIFKLLLQHKIITGLIIVLIIIGGYFGYQKLTGDKSSVQYNTAEVKRGTLIVSVSGSGQVSVSNQIDIKPKVSGEVVYVGVKNGQEVKTGTLIVQLDARDAQKAVRDAEIGLANAELTLKNLGGKTEESLAAAYEDVLNILTNTFKDLSPMVPALKPMFLESSYGGDESDIDYYLRTVRFLQEVRTDSKDSNQLSYWSSSAEQKYLTAQTQFDAVRTGYFALSHSSPHEQIEIILNQTYDTALGRF